MPNHVKDLLEALFERLRRRRAKRAWRRRLRRQPTTDLGVSAAELIREERALRDRHLADILLRSGDPD